MTTLAQYIDDQGILHQVDASYTVRDAVRYMTDRGTGAVGVLVFGELVGVLTERDVLKRVVAPEMDLDTTLVYEVMTPVVVTAELTDSVAEAVECMRERGCRHVMVQHPRRRADFVGFLGRDELLLAEHRRQSNVLPFGSPREIVDDGSVPIDLAA
ncbi:MAG: CBS domain-containing protein [Nannocystaceae bacterium]